MPARIKEDHHVQDNHRNASPLSICIIPNIVFYKVLKSNYTDNM